MGAADLDERGTLGEGNFGKLRRSVRHRRNVQGFEKHFGMGQTGVAFVGVERSGDGDEHVVFGMVELATWRRTSEELVNRKACPWDDQDRRPSHADRRNFLRHAILVNDFNAALTLQSITKKLKSALNLRSNSLHNLESTGFTPSEN